LKIQSSFLILNIIFVRLEPPKNADLETKTLIWYDTLGTDGLCFGKRNWL